MVTTKGIWVNVQRPKDYWLIIWLMHQCWFKRKLIVSKIPKWRTYEYPKEDKCILTAVNHFSVWGVDTCIKIEREAELHDIQTVEKDAGNVIISFDAAVSYLKHYRKWIEEAGINQAVEAVIPEHITIGTDCVYSPTPLEYHVGKVTWVVYDDKTKWVLYYITTTNKVDRKKVHKVCDLLVFTDENKAKRFWESKEKQVLEKRLAIAVDWITKATTSLANRKKEKKEIEASLSSYLIM